MSHLKSYLQFCYNHTTIVLTECQAPLDENDTGGFL